MAGKTDPLLPCRAPRSGHYAILLRGGVSRVLFLSLARGSQRGMSKSSPATIALVSVHPIPSIWSPTSCSGGEVTGILLDSKVLTADQAWRKLNLGIEIVLIR
jgi:hypothetical protein